MPNETLRRMEPSKKPPRLLTAKNGFVLHASARRTPQKVKMTKSAGAKRIYGISYAYPVPMPVTLSN